MELKLWGDNNPENITGLAVGYGFTVILTEKNKLWAMGNNLLAALDMSSEKPIEITHKLP
jgi:alpha-tubulin suppressor-like RCC1 family protein